MFLLCLNDLLINKIAEAVEELNARKFFLFNRNVVVEKVGVNGV